MDDPAVAKIGVAEPRHLLSIRLLGPLEIRDIDGEPVVMTSRKARLLLAYLAAKAGIPQSRDQLATLLWSDRGDEQARASLRQALLAIRSAIGPAAACIAAGTATVVLDVRRLSIDLSDFMEVAQNQDRGGLAKVEQLYRGELLEGESVREPVYEDWLAGERRRLQQIAAKAFQRLGETLLAGGNHVAAIDASRRLLTIDPMSESGHRLLIAALAVGGDRAAALAQYSFLREVLARELGVQPDAATETLIEEIRRGRVGLALAADSDSGASSRKAPLLPGFRSNAMVLVIPFRDADPEAEPYFADGLTEDVIDGLSSWRWMPVIGRATSMHIRDFNAAPLAVAADLGAAYVVSGVVRRGNGQIRLSVEMIDVATGRQIWNMRSERPVDDLFAVQGELTHQIVAAIEPEVAQAEMQRIAGKSPGDLTAWDHVVRAKWAKASSGPGYGTREGNDEAIAHLEKALQLDPQSSQVLALLSECHWHSALLRWSDSPSRSMELALDYARRAAETDGSNWLAYTYLGLLQLFGQHELPSALTNVERGVELNPSSSLARHIQGCTLGYGGDPQNALPPLDLALQLDPRYVHRATIIADKSLFYFLMGELETAAELARRALAEQPGYLRAQQRLVAALSAAGKTKEAKAELKALRRLQPDFSIAYITSTYPLVQSRDMEAFVAAFRKIGVS